MEFKSINGTYEISETGILRRTQTCRGNPRGYVMSPRLNKKGWAFYEMKKNNRVVVINVSKKVKELFDVEREFKCEWVEKTRKYAKKHNLDKFGIKSKSDGGDRKSDIPWNLDTCPWLVYKSTETNTDHVTWSQMTPMG